MPPKEKAEKPVKETVQIDLPPIPEHLLKRHPVRWVQVHFKLVGFSALNDIIRLPSTANLHMVEAKIVEHHGGSISKLSMWQDEVSPKHVIRDFGETIRERWKLDDAAPRTIPDPNVNAPNYYSYNGGPKKQQGLEDHHVVVYYEYKAHESDCPLLLRSPRYRRVDEEIQRERERREKEKK